MGEPAENPSLPKHRRRRWLIVAFVLAPVLMVSWWYWPRGDARFVGKWRVAKNIFQLDTLEFDRSRVEIRYPKDSAFFDLVESHHWATRGDVLRMDSLLSDLLPDVLTDWIFVETGWLLSPAFPRCHFQFSPDGNSVLLKDGEFEAVLERIPE